MNMMHINSYIKTNKLGIKKNPIQNTMNNAAERTWKESVEDTATLAEDEVWLSSNSSSRASFGILHTCTA